jgi:hypothetical protein
MSAWRLSMSSTRKTNIAPAYSWLPEAVDTGVDVAVEAGAVQCIEAAAAVAAEAAAAAVAAVGAEAAAHGLDLSGSANFRQEARRSHNVCLLPHGLVPA